MKVGILSMQRIYNYGSFLQAYALKTLLEQRGHEVLFVDIEKKTQCNNKKRTKLQRFIGRVKYIDKFLFRRIQDSKKNEQLNILFKEQQKKYLKLEERNMTSDGCEAVIIGSDEIFNCSPISEWGITEQRFGKIPGVPNVLSYAASCGYTGMDDLDDGNIEIIKDSLACMKGISVRDKNTERFVKELISKSPEMNLDPVLIFDFKDEIARGEQEGIPKYPYMVVYAYHNRIDSPNEINAIKKYAKRHGLKTIAIGGSLPWCDEFVVITPFQVLAYFKHAACVVTDTFHGTVISAKLNRPVAVLVRDSNMNKLDDLLKRLHIGHHKVSDVGQLEQILQFSDNYEECNKIIANECKHTKKYFDVMGL